jgi:hypothetical protein
MGEDEDIPIAPAGQFGGDRFVRTNNTSCITFHRGLSDDEPLEKRNAGVAIK